MVSFKLDKQKGKKMPWPLIVRPVLCHQRSIWYS